MTQDLGSGPETAHSVSQRLSDDLYVWGVDGKSSKLAIGYDGLSRGARSLKFTKGLHGGRRLAAIYRESKTFAAALARRYPPAYVWCEEIVLYHDRPSPILYQAAGCIMAGIYDALEFDNPHPVTVDVVMTKDWKKRSVGNGAAKKDAVMWWARQDGYTGLDQDEADAYCIAVAGRKLLEPAPEQLALA